MSQALPDWLSRKLGAAAGGDRAGGLAIATLGEERSFGRGGFVLSSPAFADGDELDPCFTADEEDAVAPPLEWTAPPPGAQELAIVVEDVDAGGDSPRCHWLVWGLPGQKGKLLEGEAPPRVGKNGVGNSEWLLPDVPPGSGAHRFVFQLFALELPLTLMPGAGRDELLAQMRGNVMASALITASYEGYDEEEDWDEGDDA